MFLWSPYVIGQTIIFLPRDFYLLSSSFFPRLISAATDWMSTILLHMAWPSANLRYRSETYGTRLAEYTGRKKRQKSPSPHYRTSLSGYIFANKACMDNQKKNLLNVNISSTCLHNMVNFGPLAAEGVSLVWGTPANFNGFRILAVLLHGTLVAGVSQTLRR